jgi:Na+/H+ antiporter NhaD/arsenite permease-like protein
MDAIFLAIAASSILVAGEVAKQRGRSFKVWAWTGAIIGPLAVPVLFLLPSKQARDDGQAERS